MAETKSAHPKRGVDDILAGRIKLKMKVAGSFRSADGGSNFCSVLCIIDTVRKNGGNGFEALAQLFNNSFSLTFLS
ncbi:MAG: hypothetical protein A2Y31_05630 [Spirochaetes bacterium GWC2_52_13]|nr:MAG: hypothetical protein A2Y31_05630 [Spirochaetes bacterium GWC2_52_13]HCG62605.1 hypothetical protein [Sphaerochaeta sp.]